MYDTINGVRVLECGCTGVCWQDSIASEQYDANRDEEDVAGYDTL